MGELPVLNIHKFENFDNEGEFYTNIFSTHLSDYHAKISHPHKHDFYVVVLFTKGTGIHEIDFQNYTVEPGTIFILKPGQTHYWEFTEDIEGFIFFHSKAFYEEAYSYKKITDFPFFYSSQNPPKMVLKENMKAIEQLFSQLYNDSLKPILMKKEKMVALVDLIYLELTQYCMDNDKRLESYSSSYYDKLNKLEELIDGHYKTKKKPKEYADLLDISTKHLNRIVREMINKTTSDLICERIILEAKREMLNSANTLDAIAWSLGYEDYAYFSRFFKKHCKVTPSEFQKKYKIVH